ncbi:MAG: type II toxin-antitoxin system HicA family toxin [Spirochaetota bacterium]
MSKEIPSLKPKDVIKILSKLGFKFHRPKGSHKIYTKDEFLVIVPDHNKDLKKGTLVNIAKGTGLSLEEFFKY